MKKNVQCALGMFGVLFLGSVLIFAQAQPSTAQGATDADSPANSIKDKDIEMLRADIRAQRKEITAQNMSLTADEATKF